MPFSLASVKRIDYPAGMVNPFLIGERVYFRPLEHEDAAMVASWLNDPEVRAFLRIKHPINRTAEIEFIDKLAGDMTSLVLLLALKADDRPIGVAGFQGIDPRCRKAELGISIGATDCWSQGYGREATALLLDHAFDTLNLHRVFLQVYAHNERGIRCYEKLGFQREGVLRDDDFREGRYGDTIVMGILHSEWKRPSNRV